MENYIDEKDFLDLIESCLHLIHHIILNDPMIFSNPDIKNIIINNITHLLSLQIENIEKYNINYILKLSMNYYFSYFYPCRSYPNTIILKKPNNNIIKNKIDYLKNIPQPEQRTNEWYLFRYNLLTASNIWKAYGSDSTRNQLIYEKCKPINLDKYNSVNMDSSLHWGQKYEDISIEWYEKQYNTTITDFGCIPHSELSYIGASPDGINTNPKSDRYGRMLEVKNIVNREINGIPKMDYWIQMQIQMEVCNLNECDFLETRFIEYDSYNSFINDGDFNTSETNNTKGIIICFIKDEKPLYVYAPLYIQKEEYEKWEETVFEEHKHLVWLKNIYWKLDEISCVLVLRNKFWFNSTKHMLSDLWKNIIYDRQHGYEHRAPKKRKKHPITNEVKCNIYVENNLENKVENVVENVVENIVINTPDTSSENSVKNIKNVTTNTKNTVIVIDI
tara:strand:+ start:10199 stop:11539 length:1341 start_codon:yes stop_codon:yes gene_type:complete